MSGIGGFCSLQMDYLQNKDYYRTCLEDMGLAQAHRGGRQTEVYLDSHGGIAVPYCLTIDGRTWVITFDGDLYNETELKELLLIRGWHKKTMGKEELVLRAYVKYGRDFVKQINGACSFVIWDDAEKQLLLYRDRSGIKPLFYSMVQDQLLFASELKGLLAHPQVCPRIDKQGLNEIFSMGPAKTYGCGVYEGIQEVLPGHYAVYDAKGLGQTCYWKLESHPHQDDYAATVEKTSALVLDSIHRQMVCREPVCTLLSGGLDSSLISAVCAHQLRKQGRQLTTYSFDFTDNDLYFSPSAFQPSQDRPYVDQMVKFLGSDHKYLECSTQTQVDYLKQSVMAHDLPAMADVDSSLLYFCSRVKEKSGVTLTGECADEIFGGYPWFHKQECFDAHTFPWTMNLEPRKALLRDDFVEYLNMEEYVTGRYEASLAETPRLEGEDPTEARRREIAYLNQKWFMQTLLDRMDRTSMQCGLIARVPFADYRLIEYIWNVPWDMKTKDGVVKHLLRECGKGYLPEEVLLRRKSPYPKTYDTRYEALLTTKVRELLEDSSSPVLSFLDRKKVEEFLGAPSDYGKPWYGQLMAGPQMLAYIWQINYWMKEYGVDVIG